MITPAGISLDENFYPYSYNGKVTAFLGNMFASKTTRLISEVDHHQIAGKKCVIVKFSGDHRYNPNDSVLTTHRHMVGSQGEIFAIPQRVLCNIELFRKIFDEWIEVIGVDEGQFYPDTKRFCEAMANSGRICIVCGLDGTFHRDTFHTPQSSMSDLIPICEKYEKLTAICHFCKCEGAAFTKKISEDNGAEVEIGGADKYLPCCRHCYFTATAPLPLPPPPLPQSSPPPETLDNVAPPRPPAISYIAGC